MCHILQNDQFDCLVTHCTALCKQTLEEWEMSSLLCRQEPCWQLGIMQINKKKNIIFVKKKNPHVLVDDYNENELHVCLCSFH